MSKMLKFSLLAASLVAAGFLTRMLVVSLSPIERATAVDPTRAAELASPDEAAALEQPLDVTHRAALAQAAEEDAAGLGSAASSSRRNAPSNRAPTAHSRCQDCRRDPTPFRSPTWVN